MLAHEIKNPLSGIRGAAQLLEQSADDEDRALTQLICEEADRIVKLVDRMEVFSDERPVAREPVNIHVVLDHVKKLAQSGFGRHVRFVEEYDPSLPPFTANKDQLIQVFLNLVKNAAEAIGERARRRDHADDRLSARRASSRCRARAARVSLPLEVCVATTARACRPISLPHLFDPFVTTKTTGHRPGPCAGCQDRRRSWRHRRMRSQPRRTTFRVLLPMYRADDDRRVRRRGTMPAGSILVADDDAAIRTVLNQALSRAGYEVRSTGNATTLWRWVSQGEGDLVITDVVMPDENAFDMLPRIKKLRPELPVIVMSAQNTLMTAIKASERGAYDYLPKPFDLKELIAIVGRALTEPKARQAARAAADEAEAMPLVGRSAAMQDIYRVLARLMQTDLTVMITGESGTGKELVARALHDYGKRRQGAVRRHQHGGDPARPDRIRAVRPREGRLHRRQCALGRPLRAGRGRHALPRRDRRHADGGADAAAARAAAGRIHDGRRPHRRSRPTSASSPPPTRTCASSSSRACSARICSSASTSCRCGCRPCASARRTCPISCATSSAGEREGLPLKQIDAAAMDGSSATAGRAMCASLRISSAASPRSIRRR